MKVEYIHWPLVKNSNKAWCRRQALHIREVFDQIRPILTDSFWGLTMTGIRRQRFPFTFCQVIFTGNYINVRCWLSEYFDGRMSFLIRYLILSDKMYSPHFIIPEGSFSCSQPLASCLCPRPYKSSPCHTIPHLYVHVDKYSQTSFFPQVSLPITVYAFLFFFMHATFFSHSSPLELFTSTVYG